MKTPRSFSPGLLCLGFIGFAACLAWFYFLTPRWDFVSYTNSRAQTSVTNSPMIPKQENETEGLFWISLKNKPQLVTPTHYILRVRGCIEGITINGQDLPQTGPICNKLDGIEMGPKLAEAFKKESHFYFSGKNYSPHYGILIDKSWQDPKVLAGLFAMALFLVMILFQLLPYSRTEKVFISSLLLIAFYVRYYFVMVLAPPEMTIFSDMNAYFHRAEDFARGTYSASQIFQPIGFSLWSWLVRLLGGWELFNWAQVLLSVGTVFLIFAIARRYLGVITAYVVLVLSSLHLPQILLSSLHMAETLYAFLLMLGLWFVLRLERSSKWFDYSIAGFVLVAAFYVKGTHSFFFPLFGLWLLWRNRGDWKVWLQKNAAFALGCLVLIVPHMIWTSQSLGTTAWAPRAGALNFVEGKCPWKDNIDSRGERWLSPLFVHLKQTQVRKWNRPFSDEKYFWQQGWQCVHDNPLVLLESVRYIFYLAAGNPLWPTLSVDRGHLMSSWEPYFYFVFLPLVFMGLLWRKRSASQFYEITLMLIFSLMWSAWFFKSENRFRVPFDGILILYAGFAVESAWVWFGTKTALFNSRSWQIKDSSI